MAEPVEVMGAAATSAFGRGVDPLLTAAYAGTPAFAQVSRFDVSRARVDVAATMPDVGPLRAELAAVIGQACDAADLDAPARAAAPLLLATHGGDPDRHGSGPEEFATDLTVACGLAPGGRAYPSACVAASTAVADAAAMINQGYADRVVVAAGYLVEPTQFALFDAGRALARDGRVRPFSARRTGALLGDGVAAVVIESTGSARGRAARPLARLVGWGRSGDGHHVVLPRPDGAGLARAISAALARGGIGPAEVGYINAHGSGTAHSDAAEAAAVHRSLGPAADAIPVSSTKSVHGQALEASGLLELVVTIFALRDGRLPVNAGYLGADEDCRLDLVLDGPRSARPEFALSLNCAFGGANTALLVGAA
jgi:3-oxoacyl-[acyl-carrier-protein] synthase II